MRLMRRRHMRSSRLILAAASMATVVGVGCVARVHGEATASEPSTRITVVHPVATFLDAPAAEQLASPFDGLALRMQQATTDAAAQGAQISVTVLDRATGELISNGTEDHSIALASVSKLFIADDLLMKDSGPLSATDRAALDLMLRSSDDDAAENFWNRDGGNAIITRVAARYGLTGTSPGSYERWWNTLSTGPDLVRYYDMLLSGAGGLPPERANMIIADLAHSTPIGVDGYPQRFGIPDGLYAEPVAVKQGWMCCIGSDWSHLSTGVVGADRRYVVVIESLQTSDDATARQTITAAVKTMFPDGRI